MYRISFAESSGCMQTVVDLKKLYEEDEHLSAFLDDPPFTFEQVTDEKYLPE